MTLLRLIATALALSAVARASAAAPEGAGAPPAAAFADVAPAASELADVPPAARTEPGVSPAPIASDRIHVGSALGLEAPALERIGLAPARARSISSRERAGHRLMVLSPERAKILLRSLTVPGWGQASLGRNGSARVFLLLETGVWASFTAFHIQQQMRRDSYERSARIFAGIELRGRDEEYRRIVGGFLSSDDYNLYVVYRDAANLYYDDPVRYRAYIAEHELKGSDAWRWTSIDDLLRYRAQRKDSQRAGQRATTTIALAIANRFVSAVHAARLAGRAGVQPRSWNFEVVPAGDAEHLALRCGVRARF